MKSWIACAPIPIHPPTRLSLHFLKGSALNLGFDSLAKLCSQGEKATITALDLTAVILAYENSKAEFNNGHQHTSAA